MQFIWMKDGELQKHNLRNAVKYVFHKAWLSQMDTLTVI